MSRQLRDWGLLGSASNSSALMRVFSKDGVLLGSFTVTPGTTSVMAKNASWSGTGWDDSWGSAEVISVANGHVYAAPTKDPSLVTALTGEDLIANFNLGPLPLGPSADPTPSF